MRGSQNEVESINLNSVVVSMGAGTKLLVSVSLSVVCCCCCCCLAVRRRRCLRSFARLFWNQIFTWRSDNPIAAEMDALRCAVMYVLLSYSASSSTRCFSVYTVLYLSRVLVLPVSPTPTTLISIM